MPFKSLKNHLSNLATSVVADKVSNFVSMGKQKDAGKVAAQLLSKSPFDIPASPSDRLRENPLSFSPVQYPLDLGSNELGHYILFESGFIGYSPQTSAFRNSNEAGSADGGTVRTTPKITAKVPGHSITTSGIALYMPNSVKVSYNQTYDTEQETGLVGDLESAGVAISGAEGSAAKVEAALQGVVGSTARNAKAILGEFVALAGAGDPVRFAAKRAGVAVNPRNETFYSSPAQRSFSFEFDFWPRNMKEAEAVEKIIAIFKYNSAPGFADKTQHSVFTIPNYWRISYMYNNGENPHLNKIGACYCQDVNIDYAPDGQYTTFENGMPVHTKMTVTMLEDRIITKSDIEAGA